MSEYPELDEFVKKAAPNDPAREALFGIPQRTLQRLRSEGFGKTIERMLGNPMGREALRVAIQAAEARDQGHSTDRKAA